MGLFDFLRSEKRGDNFLRAVFGGYGAANKTEYENRWHSDRRRGGWRGGGLG